MQVSPVDPRLHHVHDLQRYVASRRPRGLRLKRGVRFYDKLSSYNPHVTPVTAAVTLDDQ